ncbi:MAG: hypothetical protein COT71_00725 [Candidatus Andersenbacteria bacterium CG10_big_fil_rev_8_21_14_0_10_54_11]|uniref:Gluconeogenesis factor n=1 Tax=Candidatus Andersenbacteria bacterium CG10_big_fil_rev_8_21_14_0_10_54_11 TaxID=1974485 RepID=A0A2M6X018_9BACT|nr:MAG: hypothetical protein COT71_00725 [Candidatus Andersenbacteria bacterium CG10_big_fil_rev_8_21_14_0_10_54_11]
MSIGKPHIVLLGGGNGTSRMLASLVPLLQDGVLASLHALVLNADDGGSTGRLRAQYQVSAMGDLTKCLMALSGFHGDTRGEQLLAALDYRFERGDFTGHTLRNIFLTSLERTSDLDAGIAMMARILQIPKNAGVVPVTLKPLTQQVVITFAGKKRLLGEGQHFISHKVNLQADPRWQPGDVRVQFAEGDAPLNPRARGLLSEATHIVVAPGHTFGTILPTLALPQLGAAVRESSAEVWTILGLLTTPRQTEGWSGEDFVQVYTSSLGRDFSQVVSNRGRVPLHLEPGQDWVVFSGTEHPYRLLQEDLVSADAGSVQLGDVVPRAVVVHDSGKMERVFRQLLAKERD